MQEQNYPQTPQTPQAAQLQNQQDAAALAQSLNIAQETPQPFMAVDNAGKPVVVGDVADVASPQDYEVIFNYPKQQAVKFEDAVDLGNGWVSVTRSFKDVQITPIMTTRLRHAVAVVWEHFTTITEQNTVEVVTVSDAFKIYKQLPDDLIDAMLRIVQVALGVSDYDIQYITAESLLSVTTDLVTNNAGFFQ